MTFNIVLLLLNIKGCKSKSNPSIKMLQVQFIGYVIPPFPTAQCRCSLPYQTAKAAQEKQRLFWSTFYVIRQREQKVIFGVKRRRDVVGNRMDRSATFTSYRRGTSGKRSEARQPQDGKTEFSSPFT